MARGFKAVGNDLRVTPLQINSGFTNDNHDYNVNAYNRESDSKEIQPSTSGRFVTCEYDITVYLYFNTELSCL